MSKEMEQIAEQIKAMHFRKKLLGGVDEADVWRQLEALDKQYQAAFDAQAHYYQALIDEREQAIARLTRRKGSAHE